MEVEVEVGTAGRSAGVMEEVLLVGKAVALGQEMEMVEVAVPPGEVVAKAALMELVMEAVEEAVVKVAVAK